MGKHTNTQTEQEALWQVSIDDESLKGTFFLQLQLPISLKKLYECSVTSDKEDLLGNSVVDITRGGVTLAGIDIKYDSEEVFLKGNIQSAKKAWEKTAKNFTRNIPLFYPLVAYGTYQSIMLDSLNNSIEELKQSQISIDNPAGAITRCCAHRRDINIIKQGLLYSLSYTLQDSATERTIGRLSGKIAVTTSDQAPYYHLEFFDCRLEAYSLQVALDYPTLYSRSVIAKTVRTRLVNANETIKKDIISQLVKYSDQLSIIQLDDFIALVIPVLQTLNKQLSDGGSLSQAQREKFSHEMRSVFFHTLHKYYQTQYFPNEKLNREYYRRYTKHFNSEMLVNALEECLNPYFRGLSGLKLREILESISSAYALQSRMENSDEQSMVKGIIDNVNRKIRVDFQETIVFAKLNAKWPFKTAKWYRRSSNAVKPNQSQVAILAEIEMLYAMEARDLNQQLGDDHNASYDLLSSDFTAIQRFIQTSKSDYNNFSRYLAAFLSEKEKAALDNLQRGSNQAGESDSFDTSSESEIDEKETRRRGIRAAYSRQVLNSIHAYRWFNAEQPFYQSIKREYRAITARSLLVDGNNDWYAAQIAALKNLLIVHQHKNSVRTKVDSIYQSIVEKQRMLPFWAFMRKSRLRKFLRVLGEFNKQYAKHQKDNQVIYAEVSSLRIEFEEAASQDGDKEPPAISPGESPTKLSGKENYHDGSACGRSTENEFRSTRPMLGAH